MKLSDPTNNIRFKRIHFLENNNKQPRAIHYKGDMYVHVTDKEKDRGRRNLIHVNFLCLDDQHPSESSVNIIFKNSLVHKYELNMRNYLSDGHFLQHGTCTPDKLSYVVISRCHLASRDLTEIVDGCKGQN